MSNISMKLEEDDFSKTDIWRIYQIRSDGGSGEQAIKEEQDTEMERNSEDEGETEQEQFTDDERPTPVIVPEHLPLANTPTNPNGEWGLTREDKFPAGVAARKPAKHAKARAAKNYAKANRTGFSCGPVPHPSTVQAKAAAPPSRLALSFVSHMNKAGSIQTAPTISPSVIHNLKRSRLEDDAEEQEPEANHTKKKKSKNPPGYCGTRYKRTPEEIEVGTTSRPYNQREPSGTASPGPESDRDDTVGVGSNLLEVHTLRTKSVERITKPSIYTPSQGKAKLGWGLDDKTKKMLMDAGIGIANPLCRCPCHGGNLYDHTAQKCHCMSKEALAKKY